jgi:hypothetical protein
MDEQLYLELYQSEQEKRQPRCTHCHEPLVIEETHYTVLEWKWDQDYACYYKVVPDKGRERPCCTKCKGEFRLWMGETKFLRDLGLDY